MITRLRIQGFRGIADETIEFGPLTVLVGRNGAGKSAVVDALRFIRDALFDGLENAVSRRNGFDAIRHCPYGGILVPRVAFDAMFDQHDGESRLSGSYRFALVSHDNDVYRVVDERCVTHETDPQGPPTLVQQPPLVVNRFGESRLGLMLPRTNSFSGASKEVTTLFRGIYYHLFSSDMREPRAASNERILSDDAANLTTVLREMQRAKDGGAAKRAVLDALGRIVPDVRDFRVQELAGFLVAQLLHGPAAEAAPGNGHGSRGAGTWLGLHQESDGTLRALATLAALYQEVPPSYGGPLSLEEPENALHPDALAVLADSIREAATRRQIILTTQSPDLIARFRADELRVVERVDGATRVGPLAEHQRKAIEQELFGAGDLLRIEGLQRDPVTSIPTQDASA